MLFGHKGLSREQSRDHHIVLELLNYAHQTIHQKEDGLPNTLDLQIQYVGQLSREYMYVFHDMSRET